MQEDNRQNHQSGDITLKELILKVREYFMEVLKYWWLIGLMCFITTSYFLYNHYKHVPLYNAELRFIVEGQGGSGGGLTSLLGSFGIKKGGKTNPYKILEVGKSSKLFKTIIFSKFSGDTTIANQLMKEYDLINKWSEQSVKYENFHFENDSMNRAIEKRVFKKLKRIVWGSPQNEALLKYYLDEEKGIYSIKSETVDEELSIALTNTFYNSIKQFFEDEVFENQKRSAEILSRKADSLKTVRTNKVYELARFEDRNHNILNRENMSRKTILMHEIQALALAYSELKKNHEMSDINLKNWQPFFIEIDRPFAPLPISGSSLIRNLVYGVLVGLFFGVLIIVFRKIYKEVMS